MPRLPLVVLLALLLAAPVAMAGLRVQDRSPVTNTLLVPQVFCVFQFDAPGRERCDVTGNAQGINEIRFRVQGNARVFGIVDDVSNPALTRQIATINCVTTCVVEFPRQSNALPIRIVANIDGLSANTITTLSVQSGVGAGLA